MFGVPSGAKTQSSTRALKSIAAALLISTSLSGSFVLAAESDVETQIVKSTTPVSFSISSGSLAEAISAFGRTANLQIFYPADLVRGKKSAGVTGAMPEGQALEKILSESGLRFRYIDENTITISGPQQSRLDGSSVVQLDEIRVTGTNVRSGKGTSISIGADEVQTKYAANIDSLLRAQAGVFTKNSDEQKGLIVNIRGMQGPGRVNSMIDDVPQNFRNVSGHSGTHDPLVYVDPILLAGVDIQKGAVDGANGMGVLSGAANFRTISADDVILEGQESGVMLKTSLGTNGQDFSSMVAGATNFNLDGFGEGSVLAAYAVAKTDSYKDGKGQTIPGTDLYRSGSQVATFDPVDTPTSGLLKVNYAPTDAALFEFGAMQHKKSFFAQYANYIWSITNKSAYAKFHYSPAGNLIDLHSRAYLGLTDVVFPESGGGAAEGREGKTTSYGFDVDNTSHFILSEGLQLNWLTGLAFASEEFKANDARGSNPQGGLQKYGIFTNAGLSYGQWDLTLGLRYDGWQTDGITEYETAGHGSCPSGGSNCPYVEEERSGNDINPSIELTYQPLDWLQVYGRYAHSTRPPSTSEMFYAFHDFNGTGNSGTNNLALLAEQQKGWDIGFKMQSDNLLFDNDQGRLTVNYFNNQIENYIGQGVDEGTAEDLFAALMAASAAGDYVEVARIQTLMLYGSTLQYQNYDETVHMQGVEVGFGYDIGYAYLNGAYAWSETNQPKGMWTGVGNSTGMVPKHVGTLDLGTRWLDESLILGGRMRYVGDSGQPMGMWLNGAELGDYGLESYTLYDLYGNYKYSESLEFFANVENVFDKYYIPAQSSPEQIESGAGGPGRTLKAGLTLRF
ncbi:MAG: TonB-dependent receptor [Parvibaculaceae bacterium]|nr:TonB-dependent receptor [Parvibaculaceae bacterium]